MERTMIKDAFTKEGEVLLKGWVHDTRDLKKVRFLILKDTSDRIQVTGVEGKTDKKVFDLLDNLNRESAIEVIGEVKESKQAPGGKEILPKKIEIISQALNPLPIDISDYSITELPKRLDWRFLDLHAKKTQSIFKVQSTILQAYRDFMIKEGAIEAVFPSIIGSSSEGGTDLFKIKYFEKEACLSQSCQLYKQMLACSMEKVFAIFTVWRAEKHNTVRHLNEARQFDYEEAFADDKKVMNVLGRCMQFIVKRILEERSEELRNLGVELKIPSVKYFTFAEVKEIMKKKDVKMGSHDLSGDAEKKLNELYPDTIIFVHNWPLSGKPFYIMPAGENSSRGFDAIWKGMEISSGGQRIHIPELLIERLKAKKLNPDQFEAYINSFRYGAPPHAGWGVGLERITMLALGLNNIREAVLFPRDRDRITP
ncbi:MAG: aspartate--tRNA(Asn) ligase [Candidatus Pacearchaeota archaeon]